MRRNKTDIYKFILSTLCNLVIASLLCWATYWIVIITTTCSFHTPTGSMTPTIMPEESGLINKWKMGARIFNILDAVKGKPYTIHRLPGYSRLQRGDIVVFNYPFVNSVDSIAMNLKIHYCKRAIAVAGDTLEIHNCFYYVRGCSDTLGIISEQQSLQDYVREYAVENPDPRDWPGSMKCVPKHDEFNWTIRDMGPLLIPAQNTVITLNYRNYILYRKYIEWETGKKLHWQNGCAKSGDRIIDRYRFTENYFFAAGDHAINSRDSRHFGLVPEKFIVGTVGLIWDSDKWMRVPM